MQMTDMVAGEGQTLVVYTPDDTGGELDPPWIFQTVAGDVQRRAGEGWRLVTMTSMPLRHSGAFAGREGSGYETKVAVACVFAKA